MADLVDRLRRTSKSYRLTQEVASRLMHEAADEIERLRKAEADARREAFAAGSSLQLHTFLLGYLAKSDGKLVIEAFHEWDNARAAEGGRMGRRYSLCETTAAITHHVRLLQPAEKPYFGGNRNREQTLCGMPVGWDIPGKPEPVCGVCLEAMSAAEEGKQ